MILVVEAPIVQAWPTRPPEWLEVHEPLPALRDDARWSSLDLGERAALALAVELQPAVLPMDERAGTALARGLGLRVTGTLGALDEAARQKLIALPDAIKRLKQTSFRYPRAVVAWLLEDDARRRS